MSDMPCFYILQYVNASDRIEIFLKLAKYTQLNLMELRERFTALKKSGICFQSDTLCADSIQKFHSHSSYVRCQEYYKTISAPLNIKDFEACKVCPYSDHYVNKNRNSEASILKYLFNHSDEVTWAIKNPKTLFRSNHLLLFEETDRTKIMTVQLFYRIYLAAKKNVVGTGVIAIPEIWEQIQSQLLLSSFRGIGISQKIIIDTVQRTVSDELNRANTLTDKEFVDLSLLCKKRYSYRPKAFMPEEMKPFCFSSQDTFTSPLGESKTTSRSIPKEHLTTPCDDNVYNLNEIAKIAAKQKNYKNYGDPVTKETPPELPMTPEPCLLKNDTESICKTSPDDNEYISILDIKKTSPSDDDYNDYNETIYFDERGKININTEISRFIVIPLHPHDIYSFLNMIRKEEWISVEQAFYDKQNGLLIFCGSGKAAYFLDNSIMDLEIIKCIFCRNWVTVITMNASNIFSYMLELGVYIFPSLISLSARYNALYKADLIYPISDLFQLLDKSAIPFFDSDIIRLIHNYGIFSSTLGLMLEREKQIRMEKNYLFYEFAVGTSIQICRTSYSGFLIINRTGYYHNVFSVTQKLKIMPNATTCSFHYTLTPNGYPDEPIKHDSFILLILAHIFKNSSLWKFRPVLLLYNHACITLNFETNQINTLSIVEECVCRIIARTCNKLGLGPPSIHITYHH